MVEHGNPRTSNPEHPPTGTTGKPAPAPRTFLGYAAHRVTNTTSDTLSERELTDRIQECEDLKIRIAALQARDCSALQDAIAYRKAHPEKGEEPGATGTGTELALARRETPNEGCRHLLGSQILHHDMHLTMTRFSLGILTEARAMIIALGVESLTAEQRRWVDVEINKNPGDHAGESHKVLKNRVATMVQEINPASALNAMDEARAGRNVRFIKEENLMMRIFADVPAEQGMLIEEVINDLADSLTATGQRDGRTREQLKADLFCSLLTGDTNRTPAVEINLVMTDRTLFQGGPESAHLQGYGSIPASMARQLVRGRDSDLKLKRWIRRLYTEPETSKLLAMDSRRRCFPAGLVHWVQIRDQECATPFCPNRVRHTDHIEEWFRGGATSADNASARCAGCNYTKENPGWSEKPTRGRRHGLEVTTPTGKTYHSVAPPLPGFRSGHPPDPR